MESSSIREWAQRVRVPLVILAVVSLVLAMVTVVNPTKANAEVALGQTITINGTDYGSGGTQDGHIYYRNGEILTALTFPPNLIEGSALFKISGYNDLYTYCLEPFTEVQAADSQPRKIGGSS